MQCNYCALQPFKLLKQGFCLQQTVRRKVRVYIKSWDAALIKDVATNREFTVVV